MFFQKFCEIEESFERIHLFIQMAILFIFCPKALVVVAVAENFKVKVTQPFRFCIAVLGSYEYIIHTRKVCTLSSLELLVECQAIIRFRPPRRSG